MGLILIQNVFHWPNGFQSSFFSDFGNMAAIPTVFVFLRQTATQTFRFLRYLDHMLPFACFLILSASPVLPQTFSLFILSAWCFAKLHINTLRYNECVFANMLCVCVYHSTGSYLMCMYILCIIHLVLLAAYKHLQFTGFHFGP